MTLGEFQLIDLLRGVGADRDDVLLGIGDDAAVLAIPARQRLVVSVDAIVEGMHFPRGTEAEDVGWRALAVNLSDFAAMGAVPRWATMALALPNADEEWLCAFARGFASLAKQYDVALVGGDTVRGSLNVSVQLSGTIAEGQSLLRSGAQEGDGVWVTGTLGDAALGLDLIEGRRTLTGTAAGELRRRFLRPSPRVEFGQGLCGLASAAIDVSDGLIQDAQHVARASGAGIALDVGRVPLSEASRSFSDRREVLSRAATGGDDYELLFTVPRACEAELEKLASSQNMQCTRIGMVIDGENVTCALEGKAWMPSYTGFDHFAARRPG